MKAILLILALILLFIIFIYNRLITLRNAVKKIIGPELIPNYNDGMI